ncbi:MAG: phospholipid carrier-dependent glycosyltransferase [Chloroflexota bacterium]
MQRLAVFLARHEKWIPLALFVLFLLVTLPGLDWGAPDLWNPDELVWRVIKALDGEMKFDETEPDYNYPSLPKHVMYGVMGLTRGLGASPTAMLVSARLVSVLLGGLTVLLIYAMIKMAGAHVYVRLLSAFFALSNTALVHNARFAHNDLYLLFFVTLSLFAIIKYRLSLKRGWLYLAFFSAGCAASSKYTGASITVVLLFVFLVANWKDFRRDFLRQAETLFIAATLTAGGFVLGTPKALLWASFYFKRMVPAALRFASYGRGPDSLIGLYGQWDTFCDAVGAPVYYLFLLSFAWFALSFLFRVVIANPKSQTANPKSKASNPKSQIVGTLLFAIVIFDVPFLMSYNYVPRFFLPFLPMFAVLAGLFVEDVFAVLLPKLPAQRVIAYLVSLALLLVIAASFLRVVSVALLFANDARTPAGKFLETLESGTLLEFTLYPPTVPENHFSKARNYPIYLVKYPGETVPANKPYLYNRGEDGLYERQVDYLVVDSFTYERFSDAYICETNPVECEFFNRLIAGETSLRLLASFEYSLPSFLPQISLAAVNPAIKVYEVPR